MMTFSSFTKLSAIAMLAIVSIPFVNQVAAAEESTLKINSTEKKLYLPEKVDRIPKNNDFNDVNSEYSFKHMVQGDNVAIFWSKEYGDNPMTDPNERKRFDVNYMLKECERFYNYYVNDLKLVQKGKSLTDKYKLLVVVFGGNDGTAYGGGVDDKIGALWTPAVRVNKTPYGVLAHEMGHCFQFIDSLDNKGGAGGGMGEIAAQYILWQVYPEWMTFENYHLVAFMKQTHLAFMHPSNMYHSPYVIEYWSNKHGIEFYANMCRSTQRGEDPVMTYKRLNNLTQEQFNNEMFDACRRFITWDMPRIEKVAHQYANQHQCTLNDVNDGWYRIAKTKCPQNYGYNGIKLKVPAAGTIVSLNFKGIVAVEDVNAVKKAGWRYGFLASLKDGSRVYGDVCKDSEGTATFKVPENTEFLWLVVMGAPKEHSSAGMGMGRRSRRSGRGTEEWPYQIKLTGTTLDDSVLNKPQPVAVN
jgi:hypothetical protein